MIYSSRKWIQHSHQRNPEEEKERIVELILPVGNYGLRMVWADGEVMVADNMPQPRSLEVDTVLGYEVCKGSIGLTINNPRTSENQLRGTDNQ